MAPHGFACVSFVTNRIQVLINLILNTSYLFSSNILELENVIDVVVLHINCLYLLTVNYFDLTLTLLPPIQSHIVL